MEASAPPLRITLEPTAVVRELPIWKYQASSDEPVPTSVNIPVRYAELLKLYVPGFNVNPPRSTPSNVAPFRAEIISYAV